MEKQHSPISAEEDQIARMIVDSAFAVHKALGPGLLESVYEVCLLHELKKHGLSCRRQVVVPIIYDGETLDESFRIDILVNELVIIEVKAVETTLAVHEAQLLSYMKLSQKRLGFLINFNVPLIKHGIKRMIL